VKRWVAFVFYVISRSVRAWCLDVPRQVKWGKDDKEDKASRSVIKAFAWRGFALVNTLIISLVFSKSAKTGAVPACLRGRAGCAPFHHVAVA
jgi:hypothetical protein